MTIRALGRHCVVPVRILMKRSLPNEPLHRPTELVMHQFRLSPRSLCMSVNLHINNVHGNERYSGRRNRG
jgi:hypothetical protein